jgi:superfamily II DNA helicase RecQ
VDDNCTEKEVLNFYNTTYKCDIDCLKPKQKEALKLLVKEQTDVECMLPIGYGKSLIYELLPIVHKKETMLDAITIIIEPLNIIIEQQLKKLGGNTSISLKKTMTDNEIAEIAAGKYTYIFSHPENIVGNKAVYKALRSCQQ